MTEQSLHRPESEYARQRRTVDPNPRWRTEDIVDLEIMMPHRSTPDQDDPNTLDKIKSILAMDLNDPLRKIPSSKSRAKHRENQLLSVHDGSSKSRSRRRKDKRSQKSRPTTAL
jgi:hypothetical protein